MDFGGEESHRLLLKNFALYLSGGDGVWRNEDTKWRSSSRYFGRSRVINDGKHEHRHMGRKEGLPIGAQYVYKSKPYMAVSILAINSINNAITSVRFLHCRLRMCQVLEQTQNM